MLFFYMQLARLPSEFPKPLKKKIYNGSSLAWAPCGLIVNGTVIEWLTAYEYATL
jgi:hypothetical protein